MILLIDIGNTRIKWALVDANGVILPGDSFSLENPFAAIKELFKQFKQRPRSIVISNVKDPQISNILTETALLTLDIMPFEIYSTEHSSYISNGYQIPRQLGADRWCAMHGAAMQTEKPYLVIDAGTCVTIDAVDADGNHMGGLILPGLACSAKAIELVTNINIEEVEKQQPEFLPINTYDAIKLGAHISLLSTVKQTYDDFKRFTKCEPLVFITGGDSEQISKLVDINTIVDPHLVFKGMSVLAMEEKNMHKTINLVALEA